MLCYVNMTTFIYTTYITLTIIYLIFKYTGPSSSAGPAPVTTTTNTADFPASYKSRKANLYILPSFQLFLILYVDDVLIFCYSLGRAQQVRDQLRMKYKMADLGSVKQFLGLQVRRNRDKREIRQSTLKISFNSLVSNPAIQFLHLWNLQCNFARMRRISTKCKPPPYRNNTKTWWVD